MIPRRTDMDRWTFSRMPRFEGLARTIARYPGGVTLLFAETSDGSYEVTKMHGGRVVERREFTNFPDHIKDQIDPRRRPRDARRRSAA